MPRNVRLKPAKTFSRIPAILRDYERKPAEVIPRWTPRLWNAKRRIKTSRGLGRLPQSTKEIDWRSRVSNDIAKYIDQHIDPFIVHKVTTVDTWANESSSRPQQGTSPEIPAETMSTSEQTIETPTETIRKPAKGRDRATRYQRKVVVDNDELKHLNLEQRDQAIAASHKLRNIKHRILTNPVKFFSKPENVPLAHRKQVYLPNFSITLIRTPKYGPYFAHFEVPLWFNKLDMRNYLQNVYNVDVVHVRSAILQGKLERTTPTKPSTQGRIYREKNRKRMTVQLVEPFEYPAPPEDYAE
jgi:ribosomal protein L23